MRWTDLAGPDLAPETSLGALAIGLALLDAVLWPRRPGRAPAFLTLGGLLVALSLSLQGWDPVSLGRHGLLYADPVAAFADQHWVIAREGASASLSQVSGEERVAELSRMISGDPDSESGRNAARELLESAASLRG